VEVNKSLHNQQQVLRSKYDDALKVNQSAQQRQKDLLEEIEQLHGAILSLCPNKQLASNIEMLGRPLAAAQPKMIPSPMAPSTLLSSTPPPQLITSRTMSVPTAAALKQGVGFPLNSLRKDDTGRILSTQCPSANDELMNECGICKKCTDQHLLAKCDTCTLYYHLGCLNPPLTRHPKKSKLYAWQCSECDKSDDSAPENKIIPKGPRRSRIRYSKDQGPIIPDPFADSFGSEKSEEPAPHNHHQHQHHHPIVNGSEPELEAPLPVQLLTVMMTQQEVVDVKPLEMNHEPATSSIDLTKKRGRKPKGAQSLLESVDLTMDEMKQPKQEAPPAPAATTANVNHVAVVKEKKPVKKRAKVAQKEVKQLDPLLALPSDVQITEPPKSPKKGRPRKEKKSLSQISLDLQKQHEIYQQQQQQQQQQQHQQQQHPSAPSPPHQQQPLILEPKPEVTLLDLSRKIECPLEQFRAYPNSISSFPVELPKLDDESESIPVIAPALKSDTMLLQQKSDPIPLGINGNGLLMNGDVALDYTMSSSSGHHKHKKRKSHKRRHSHSPSSGDKASNGKKHKRKRKHKNHDEEAPPPPVKINNLAPTAAEEQRPVEQPRITIKFKTILQDGDDKTQPKFLCYVPSEGRPATEVCKSSSAEEMYSSNDQVSFSALGSIRMFH